MALCITLQRNNSFVYFINYIINSKASTNLSHRCLWWFTINSDCFEIFRTLRLWRCWHFGAIRSVHTFNKSNRPLLIMYVTTSLIGWMNWHQPMRKSFLKVLWKQFTNFIFRIAINEMSAENRKIKHVLDTFIFIWFWLKIGSAVP